MRFSSIFQQPAPQSSAGDPPVRAEAAAPHPDPGTVQELPEDLDARVRLLGEWQLFEG